MKKVFGLIVALVLCAGAVFAETDYAAMPVIRDIQKGKDNRNQIEVLRVKGAATIGGTATAQKVVASAGIVGGSATVSAGTDVTTINVAGTAAVYLVNPVTTGQAVVMANPSAAGQYITLVNVSTVHTGNLADSGNVSLASAWAGRGNDSITLVSVSASAWVEVARSDN